MIGEEYVAASSAATAGAAGAAPAPGCDGVGEADGFVAPQLVNHVLAVVEVLHVHGAGLAYSPAVQGVAVGRCRRGVGRGFRGGDMIVLPSVEVGPGPGPVPGVPTPTSQLCLGYW